MDPLGPDETSLFAALRAADEPTEADRARVRQRVLVAVAATSAAAVSVTATTAAGGTATTTTGALAAATKPTATVVNLLVGWKIVWGIAILAVALAGTTGYYLTHRAPLAAVVSPSPSLPPMTQAVPPSLPATPPDADRPVVAAATAPSAASGSAETASLDEPAAKAPAAASPPRAETKSSAAANGRGGARGDDLEAELALIGAAQRALGRNAPAEAVRSLDEHARQFPRGALSSEREGLRAIASCRAGQKALASRFLARQPGSPLAARIRSACGLP
jgi:hypothetical protein